MLPQVLQRFRGERPGITVHLRNEFNDTDLLTDVQSGVCDLTFVETSRLTDGFAHVDLLVDRFVALVPPGHRLADRTSISLTDLDGEHLIDGSPEDSCTLRGQRALIAAGVTPNVVYRTDDNTTRQRLVNAGFGCAIVPGLTVEAGLPNGAVAVALEEPLQRTICLAWWQDRTMSTALRAFIDVATSIDFSVQES
jgi:DNA-binding transcriptional LysR family regulator